MDFDLPDILRIATVGSLALTGLMCLKGIMMTAAAVSTASVLGGIFLTILGGSTFAGLLVIAVPIYVITNN